MKTFDNLLVVILYLTFIIQGVAVVLLARPTPLEILRGCRNEVVVRNAVSTRRRLPTALQLTSPEKAAAAGTPLKESHMNKKVTEASSLDMSYILLRNIAQNWGFPSLDKAPVVQVFFICYHHSGKSFHFLCFSGISVV